MTRWLLSINFNFKHNDHRLGTELQSCRIHPKHRLNLLKEIVRISNKKKISWKFAERSQWNQSSRKNYWRDDDRFGSLDNITKLYWLRNNNNSNKKNWIHLSAWTLYSSRNHLLLFFDKRYSRDKLSNKLVWSTSMRCFSRLQTSGMRLDTVDQFFTSLAMRNRREREIVH